MFLYIYFLCQMALYKKEIQNKQLQSGREEGAMVMPRREGWCKEIESDDSR